MAIDTESMSLVPVFCYLLILVINYSLPLLNKVGFLLVMSENRVTCFKFKFFIVSATTPSFLWLPVELKSKNTSKLPKISFAVLVLLTTRGPFDLIYEGPFLDGTL